jgi:hypothetical protein
MDFSKIGGRNAIQK